MFKLLIECTKDIDELQINFSDGTSVVTSGRETVNSLPGTPEMFLDTGDDFPESHGTSVVEKPVINDVERSPNVASELQNLDI